MAKWKGVLRGAALAVLIAPTTVGADTLRFFADGFENPCEVDSDGDRLADCEESSQLTSRHDPDTDDDGLSDGDEVLGTASGLDLPLMGVNPRRKDLLLEIDWAADSRGCGTHSHQPPQEVLDGMRVVLAAAPLPNPDGTTGINLIVDVGQGTPFLGGSQVPLPLGTSPAPDTAEFDAFRAQHSDPRRVGYFHYQVHAHVFEGGNSSSGSSEIGGDDTVVTLQCHGQEPGWWRNTALHELGHNLGLRHGGDDDCNHKPNYNSLMNYAFQLDGIDVDCDTKADGPGAVDFSSGSRIPLDAKALSEPAGVCGLAHPRVKPIDWNHSGLIDALPVTRYISCSEYGVVADHDDFSAIALGASLARNGLSLIEGVTCADLP